MRSDPTQPDGGADGPDTGRRSAWPDWQIGHDTAHELARYVDVARTRRLVPGDALGLWPDMAPADESHRDPAVRRVGLLYDSLLAREIPYSNEPWNPNRHDADGRVAFQRVRGATETVQGPATCLDLALTFAGMCLSAELRPFVVFYSQPWAEHALVLVDVNSPLSAADARPNVDRTGRLLTADPVRVGVRTHDGLLEADDLLGANWLLVDVYRAAIGRDTAGFAQSSGVGPKVIETLRFRGERWAVVDVDRRRGLPGFAPHKPPAGRAIPPIHSYLAPTRSFRRYPSRAGLWTGLQNRGARPSVTVLYAPSGYGKSMLARQVAARQDNDAGWFLASDDRGTLVSSLAKAERAETSAGAPGVTNTGEKPDAGEDTSLAAAALARLREADAPWAVVLDNCDMDPDDSGVLDLMPVPRLLGQAVVVTTTNPKWEAVADTRPDWTFVVVPPLDESDLTALGLTPAVAEAVAGRPLVSESLAGLVAAGAVIPEPGGRDGTELMWSMLRSLPGATPAIEVARTMAWLPPEPMAVAGIPGSDSGTDTSCRLLGDLGLVSPQADADEPAVQMHRLVSAEIRERTWSEEPETAALCVARLLVSDAGQRALLASNSQGALLLLEAGDAARTAAIVPAPGLVWHAMGRVRERRGPVAGSKAAFEEALKTLDPSTDHLEFAEAHVGLARIAYQVSTDLAELVKARTRCSTAMEHLDLVDSVEGRQSREQANALYWLITQKIVGKDTDPLTRMRSYREVRDELWTSYERRRAILNPEAAQVAGTPPTKADGLGSERAYFNLAGINLQIAKTAHEIDEADQEVAAAFGQSVLVYEVVRSLRQDRYDGRPHSHLAACVNGLAIVLYYQSLFAMAGADLVTTIQLAAEGLAMRKAVVTGLLGRNDLALPDPDVGKSIELLLKATIVADIHRTEGLDKDGMKHALAQVNTALREDGRGGLEVRQPD